MAGSTTSLAQPPTQSLSLSALADEDDVVLGYESALPHLANANVHPRAMEPREAANHGS